MDNKEWLKKLCFLLECRDVFGDEMQLEDVSKVTTSSVNQCGVVGFLPPRDQCLLDILDADRFRKAVVRMTVPREDWKDALEERDACKEIKVYRGDNGTVWVRFGIDDIRTHYGDF